MKASARHDDSDPTPRTSRGLFERIRGLSTRTRWTGVAVLVLIVAFGAWLGVGAYQAKSNLEQARDNAERSKEALLSGKPEDAVRSAEIAQLHANQARAATHSLPWNLAAAIPLLGSPLKATQQISDVVVGLADKVLLPTAAMGGTVTPDQLISGTHLNLGLLRAEQPRLSELSSAATKLDEQAQSIAKPSYLSFIDDARIKLQYQTASLAQLLGSTAIAAELAPSMMGADGPRSYLMAFQTPAEARGTGGIVGGFGVLRFDNGIPTVDRLAKNAELAKTSASIDLGPAFNAQYGFTNPYSDFRNSNLSSNFPYAAQIWRSMWETKTGMTVDGVISIDTVALSYLLDALGPVTMPDGEVITGQNLVEITGSTAYIRFPTDVGSGDDGQTPRKDYLQSIASKVVEKLTGGVKSPRDMLKALARAAGERRIAVWSSSPAEQKLLEETPLAHVIPNDDPPYAEVVINNLAGNKMDYYLNREIEYAADGCSEDRRNSTITIRLTNTASPKLVLPDYVAGLRGITKQIPITAPNGTMVSSIRILTTKGANLLSVTSNGERTSAIPHVENGHPSYEVQAAIPPGKTMELVFRLIEPTSPGEARVPVQPLIDHAKPTISVPVCR